MKYTAFFLTVVSAGLMGICGTRADPMPVEGTRELRIGSSAGLVSMYGPGVSFLSPEHGSNLTLVSIGAGLGYFVAPNVEVGGTLGFFDMDVSGANELGGQSMKGPGFSVFFRLYSRNGQVGLFAEPTLEFQYLSQGSLSSKVLGPGIDLGIEIFLADSWALRLSPTYRYYKEWASQGSMSGETSINKLGLSYGISAYF